MKKRYFAILMLILLIISSLAFYGCKSESIKFYRESAVSKALNSFNQNDDKWQIKKSSGIFIYKDTSYQNNNKGQKFGPADINFDMPIRMK